MRKLKEELLEHCTLLNCCQNELAVLPAEGDVGLEEYFEHKAACIRRVKNLFSPPECNKLMLSYPPPDIKGDGIFSLFFESPSVVAKNRQFEGLFCVDISDYLGQEENENMIRLLSFMKAQPQIVYLLFICTDNEHEKEQMYQFLTQYLELDQLTFSLPTPKKLTEYTFSGVRDFCLHIDAAAQQYLEDWFKERTYGFDEADYVVRKLKAHQYQGDLDMLKDVLTEAEALGQKSDRFGY